MYESFASFALLAVGEGEKHEALELGILVFLPVVLSLVLLKIINARVAKGASQNQRWASLVPLVAGAWLAYDPFSDILDENYLDYHMVSGKSTMLHYAVLIVPCVAILGLVAYILYAAHRERMES